MASMYSCSSLIGFVSSNRRLQWPPNSVGDAEVEADGLGMADVEVAVRFGREAGDRGPDPAGGDVGGDDVADEVAALRGLDDDVGGGRRLARLAGHRRGSCERWGGVAAQARARHTPERSWLARQDSNLEPPDPESGALPLSHAPATDAHSSAGTRPPPWPRYLQGCDRRRGTLSISRMNRSSSVGTRVRVRPRPVTTIVAALAILVGSFAFETPAVEAGSLPACRIADVLTKWSAPADWGRTLVDTTYRVRRSYRPTGLVSVANAGLSGGGSVRRVALADLRAMVRSSRIAGPAWRSSRPTGAMPPRSGPSPTGRGSVAGPAPWPRALDRGTRSINWAWRSTSRPPAARPPGATATGPGPGRAPGWPGTPGATGS